jgi:hypothetical protein
MTSNGQVLSSSHLVEVGRSQLKLEAQSKERELLMSSQNNARSANEFKVSPGTMPRQRRKTW